MLNRKKIPLLVALSLLYGCSTMVEKMPAQMDAAAAKQKLVLNAPAIVPSIRQPGVEVPSVIMPVTRVSNVKSGDWLKSHQHITLILNTPTSLKLVMADLAGHGLNISSTIPLDGYTFAGRITDTDADTALKLVLGSVGLDYQTDDVRKTVSITPMSSKTWILPIGNRKSSYDTSASAPSSNGSSTSSSSTTGSSSSTTASSSGGTSTTLDQSGNTSIEVKDDFWTSLNTELQTRMTVLVPTQMAQSSQNSLASQQTNSSSLPPVPTAAPGTLPSSTTTTTSAVTVSNIATSGTQFTKTTVGVYSTNPETGAIHVQAPHWILEELDKYIQNVMEMYNTDISFKGEVVLVTSNRNESEGIDISAFASFAAGKWGAIVSNNALGGVTLSLPTLAPVLPSVTTGNQTVGPLVGATYKNGTKDALQLFNAFLATNGKVSVVQKPMITTTSGVPGVFSKKLITYYNTVSQQAAAGGTGSAATATTNILNQVELGTDLRINPRIDIASGLVRAQISLNQAIQSGSLTIQQTVNNGVSVSSIPTTIPLITKQNVSAEVLLRDGDLVILGGQQEENLQTNSNGLPGDEGPVSGGVLGVRNATSDIQTYYFAMRVSVKKRQ